MIEMIILQTGYELLKQLKMEFFLSFFASPFNIEMSKLSKIFDIYGYAECSKNLFINQKLNKSNLIFKILNSKAAISCFLKCLKSQDKNLDISETSLKQELDIILSNLKIYRVHLPSKIYGCTIQNKSIFLSDFFLGGAPYIDTLRDASALITLLHEMSHFLLRYYFHDKMTFMNITDEFFYDNKKFNECGDFAEYLLTNNNFKYSDPDSLFLLNETNWSLSIKKFKINYLKIIKNLTEEDKKKSHT